MTDTIVCTRGGRVPDGVAGAMDRPDDGWVPTVAPAIIAVGTAAVDGAGASAFHSRQGRWDRRPDRTRFRPVGGVLGRMEVGVERRA